MHISPFPMSEPYLSEESQSIFHFESGEFFPCKSMQNLQRSKMKFSENRPLLIGWFPFWKGTLFHFYNTSPEHKRIPNTYMNTHCTYLGGGFEYFLFSPLLGEMIQFDEHIFQMGWNHQLAIQFTVFQCSIFWFPVGEGMILMFFFCHFCSTSNLQKQT